MPPLPPDLAQVPAGFTAFLEGHGVGTQNYICLPSGNGVKFILFTPQATLFNDLDEQVTTHYFSPNPDEGGSTIRATWQHSQDTSTVWAKVSPLSRPVIVRPDSVPWLLLETVGVQEGPTGGDTLTPTTFIQRVNTVGGLIPTEPGEFDGHVARVPYTADYFFYRQHE